MNRALLFGLLLLVPGCVAPERLPPRLLPEDTKPMTNGELVGRARLLAAAGNEAFFINRWDDLEDSARGLEQTAASWPGPPRFPPATRTGWPSRPATWARTPPGC
jgi:hypothetical protein